MCLLWFITSLFWAGVALVCVPFVFVICFVNLLITCYTEWWLTREDTFVMVPGRPTYRLRSGDNNGGGEGGGRLHNDIVTVGSDSVDNEKHDNDNGNEDEEQRPRPRPRQ
jgi:hypothetical protein